MSLKDTLQNDMKAAMRAKDRERLGAIRLIQAAIKQREVDERIDLDDGEIITVLNRMLKQRRESIAQYQEAGREDLVSRESFEAEVIQTYLPQSLSDSEIEALIDRAIAETAAQSIRDMGKVMAVIKDSAHGRVDMARVSGQVKARLNS